MQRSLINDRIRWAKNLLDQYNIKLPEFAYWSAEDWILHQEEIETIQKVYLGWDVKEYSKEMGSVLFTIRNGRYDDPTIGVPYCEKLIMMRDGRRLPIHYHKNKTEDIINRAGGIMQIRLYNLDPQEGLDLISPVNVYQDGIKHTYQPGEYVYITPGNSITLPPYMAHSFGPKKGSDVVIGEVSKINDDFTDNYRFETIPQASAIEEDEDMLHPLCTEYSQLIKIIGGKQ